MGWKLDSPYTVIPYKHFFLGTINAYMDGSVYSDCSEVRKQKTVGNKMICFSLDKYRELPSASIRHVATTWIEDGAKLFISSAVKIPRDIFRNDYTIVRDPEKANYTVVPRPLEEQYPVYRFDVVAYKEDTESVYLFSVNRHTYNSTKVFDYDDTDLFDAIKSHLESILNNLTFYQDKLCSNTKVEILPFVQEWKDLLECTYPNREYVLDTSARIDYPTKICLETLDIWARHSDEALLARSIVNSDWADYPVTLAVFLRVTHPYMYVSNLAFDYVLKTIGFPDYRYSLMSSLEGREIQPKDWNMLQSWFMSHLGTSENGGFITAKQYIAADLGNLKSLFRQRVCVAPLYIDKPIVYDNLKVLLEE